MKKDTLLISILLLVFTFTNFFAFSLYTENLPNRSDISNNSFIIEEYRITSQEVDTPGSDTFYKRIDPKILEKRKRWREKSVHKDKISNMNEELETFNYKLVKNEEPARFQPSYNLYYKDNLVLKALSIFQCFKLNKKRDKFLFIATQELKIESGPPYARQLLIYDGDIKEWKPGKHSFQCPIFLNDTLVTVDLLTEQERKTILPDTATFAVKKGNQIVYTFSPEISPVANPIKSFFAYNNNWSLEYTNNIIINGVNIIEENNYSKLFFYHILHGKPFYFFQQNNKIYISFNDRVLTNEYDEVIHYKCCAASSFNPHGNENIVRFYALQDGFWYYVEAGVYK